MVSVAKQAYRRCPSFLKTTKTGSFEIHPKHKVPRACMQRLMSFVLRVHVQLQFKEENA
jgi:hypothetical protein